MLWGVGVFPWLQVVHEHHKGHRSFCFGLGPFPHALFLQFSEIRDGNLCGNMVEGLWNVLEAH